MTEARVSGKVSSSTTILAALLRRSARSVAIMVYRGVHDDVFARRTINSMLESQYTKSSVQRRAVLKLYSSCVDHNAQAF